MVSPVPIPSATLDDHVQLQQRHTQQRQEQQHEHASSVWAAPRVDRGPTGTVPRPQPRRLQTAPATSRPASATLASGCVALSANVSPQDRPPSVDRLARSLADTGLPHPLLVDAARAAIAAGDPESAAARARSIRRRMLTPVINGTGVLLHTNLGRAPVAWSQRAGYSNLELDIDTGERGDRQTGVPRATGPSLRGRGGHGRQQLRGGGDARAGRAGRGPRRGGVPRRARRDPAAASGCPT